MTLVGYRRVTTWISFALWLTLGSRAVNLSSRYYALSCLFRVHYSLYLSPSDRPLVYPQLSSCSISWLLDYSYSDR